MEQAVVYPQGRARLHGSVGHLEIRVIPNPRKVNADRYDPVGDPAVRTVEPRLMNCSTAVAPDRPGVIHRTVPRNLSPLHAWDALAPGAKGASPISSPSDSVP